MFNKLPFNPRFQFDTEGRFIFRGSVEENDGSMLEVDDISTGESGIFDRVWLGLIAHHRIELPFRLLRNIRFLECKSKHFRFRTGWMMLFKKPIVIENGFRVIPGYTRYHVSRDGVVKSILTGTISKQGFNAFAYPSVSVFDDDKHTYRKVVLHMLIARAWLPNPDPDVKFFVNHKDGVKSNYSLENLEWVTAAQNSEHAITSGLQKGAVPCQVLDLTDGSVTAHPSMGYARRAINIGTYSTGPTTRRVNGEILPIVLGGRYVIRTDFDPEFYSDLTRYDNLFSKRNTGPYFAKRIADGKIYRDETLAGLSAQIGVTYDHIARAINSVIPLSFSGYIFRNNEESTWPSTYCNSEPLKKRSFIVENLDTGEIMELDSFSLLKQLIGVDKATIGRKLASNKPCGKWLIRETSEHKSPLKRRRFSSLSQIAGISRKVTTPQRNP